MSGAYDKSYRFGDFTLDVKRGELFRAEKRRRIRPRSFDVLHYLLERPGTLVSRDELMDALWKGAVVTEDAVTQCLIDIRKALGDDDQSIIRTVPRRGYIFELPVEAVDGAAAGQLAGARKDPNRGWGLVAVAVMIGVLTLAAWQPWRDRVAASGAGALPVVSQPSIAVLPFESVGADAQKSYFADGISEEIINSLASQKSVKVIARTSSFSFRDQNVDVSTIASQLNVTHVLEGSVRSEGDSLRINVQLVDASTGEYIWTRQYDERLTASNLFSIQSSIATAVVESLTAELDPRQRERLARVSTRDITALDAYFEARQAMEMRRPRELDRAADLLRGAIKADPDFALAYVALAETLRLQANYGALPHPLADEQGMAAVQAALRIDPLLGNTYASLGNLHARFGQPRAAEEAYLKGIELSPGYAPLYQWYGEFLVYHGRGFEGVPYSRIAVALDPRSAIINTDYAEALAGAGRLEEALDQYDVALSIDSDFPPALNGKGGVLAGAMGRIADAIPLYERARQSSPESPNPLRRLAGAYVDLGDFARAAALLEDASRIAPEHSGWRHERMLLEAARGNAEAAAGLAQDFIATRGGWPLPLRVLRDRDLANGRVESAIDRYRRFFPHFFAETPPILGAGDYAAAIDLSFALKIAGRSELADSLLEASLEHLASRPRLAWSGTEIADVRAYAILGDLDRAIALLREAVEAGWRSRWVFHLGTDPALAELRSMPDYGEIVGVIEKDLEMQLQRLLDSRSPEST